MEISYASAGSPPPPSATIQATLPWGYFEGFFPQRFSADALPARRAISLLSSGVIVLSRAFPPLRPSDTAAWSFAMPLT